MLETLLNSLAAVAIVMAIVAVGWLFARKGYIKREHKGLMTKLIINAGMPALVMSNILGSLDLDSLENPLMLIGIPVAGMATTLAIGLLLAKILKPAPARRGGFIVMCAFSNSIFVGLPMNTGLFGNAAVPYVMIFYMVNTTFFWTVGNYLINKSGEAARGETAKAGIKGSLKKLLSPPLIALMIAIPLLVGEYFLRRSAPFMEGFRSFPAYGVITLVQRSFVKMCGYVGNIVTPLALLYIGSALYEYGFKSLRPDRDMLVSTGVRFVIAPATMLLLCKLLGLSGVGSGVFVVEAAMPVMTQAVVLAASCDADESFVAAGMCITTLGCFVLVPALMLIMKVMGLV
ncbi:MAG: AEC family transporter [Clostridiales bacterium]|nr:AEC family transporter [Clostridiales bacterium]